MSLSSCDSHSAADSVAMAPVWCAAASEVGTYVSRVEMPRPTCVHANRAKTAAA